MNRSHSPFLTGLIAATALTASALPGLTLAQTAPATPPAAPVAPVPSQVVVFSLQAVVAASAAGRDMATKVQGIQQSMNAELEAEGRAFVAERERLRQTPAAQLETAEGQRALAALQQRGEAFEVMRRRTEIDFQATNERALGQFLQALQPVMVSVVAARGAHMALEASDVRYAIAGVDITRDLVTALDASITTIAVARVRVQTDEEAAAAAAGAPAATGTASPPPAAPAGAPLPRRPTPVPVPR
jgi:Skp family chaperone for outer membrane proteins